MTKCTYLTIHKPVVGMKVHAADGTVVGEVVEVQPHGQVWKAICELTEEMPAGKRGAYSIGGTINGDTGEGP